MSRVPQWPNFDTDTTDSTLPQSWIGWLTGVAAIGMALVHMTQLHWYWLPAGYFNSFHLCMSLLLAFLVMGELCGRERPFWRLFFLLLAGCSVLIFVYIVSQYSALIGNRAFNPGPSDTAIAILLLLITLFAAQLQWGWTIPVLVLLALLYGAFGYILPGELFWHGGINFKRLISYTSIPYFQGLLGSLTEVSAGTVFLFMLFGGVLKSAGGIELIMRAARIFAGRSAAGPAFMAVISSGLMGMISGSTVANVASCGVVTIPLMKRHGFSAEFAGAVEAVASTGGQVTPPVMGLAAFLIVGITGIPYAEVAVAAAFPALIYYLYLLVGVQIRAMRINLKPDPSAMTEAAGSSMKQLGRMIVTDYLQVIFGVTVLVWLLMLEVPSGYAALLATIVMLLLEFIRRMIAGRNDLIGALRDYGMMSFHALRTGAMAGAQIATIVAVCGILVDMAAVTGFAQKLSFLLLDLAGTSLIMLLIMAAFACLVFGLGLPTSASYILVALLGAPALVQMGVPLLAAHMFVLYFANVSALTPPVALATMIASKISGGGFMKTGFVAMGLGLPGFLLPFIFVARPEMLLLNASVLDGAFVSLMALIAISALVIVIEGYFLRPVLLIERIALLPAVFAILYPGWLSTALGFALMAVILARQVWFVWRARGSSKCPLSTRTMGRRSRSPEVKRPFYKGMVK